MVEASAVIGAAVMEWQGPVTFLGLASIVVLAMVRGWLIPRSSHEREIKILVEANERETRILVEAHERETKILVDRNAEMVDEKNEWRGTAQAAERVSAEVRGQNGALLEVNRTTAYALEQIRGALVSRVQKDVNQ